MRKLRAMDSRKRPQRDRGGQKWPHASTGTFVSLVPEAEEFIASVTSGESVFEDARDELLLEDLVCPMIDIEDLET
jgi:hypothetical protein